MSFRNRRLLLFAANGFATFAAVGGVLTLTGGEIDNAFGAVLEAVGVATLVASTILMNIWRGRSIQRAIRRKRLDSGQPSS